MKTQQTKALERSSRGILVSLDALLDTRLGVLLTQFPEQRALIDEFVLSGKYHERIEDKFPGISKATFAQAYARRDMTVLHNASPITPAHDFVLQTCGHFQHERINEPFRTQARLVINVHPYAFSEEEREELARIYREDYAMGEFVEVSVISLSPEALSTQYCFENYDVMVMYHYDEWMEAQTENFKTQTLTMCHLYAPALYFGESPVGVVYQYHVAQGHDPLMAMQELAGNLIGLKLTDVALFSIAKPTA